MSISSTSSPERYCLGGLMKDIDKEPSPRDYDFDSKDQTSYKTIKDQKISLDSNYSFHSAKAIFSPNVQKNKKEHTTSSFSINTILSALDNQKSTIVLQKRLMEAPKEELNNIIKEMSGYYSQIIKDKNGNYYCSDLFKVCDKNQRIKILNEMCNTISDDCIDEYGSHPIQTLIGLSSCEEEYRLLVMSFKDNNKILKAALNQNGTHVIQKLIVHIPEQYRTEFNMIFVKFFCVLAMDMYGVCAIIKFMNYTKNEIIEKYLLNLILSNFVNIAQNQYGNYLIQNILEKWWNTNKGIYLKKKCIDKFHILASNHYSSFVCDMFLKISSLEDKQLLMTTLIGLNNINLFNSNNTSKIIMNKLMLALKQKDDNNYKDYKNKNSSSKKNNINNNRNIAKKDKNDGKNNNYQK
jgi:hypothetical protein